VTSGNQINFGVISLHQFFGATKSTQQNPTQETHFYYFTKSYLKETSRLGYLALALSRVIQMRLKKSLDIKGLGS